MEIDAFIAFDGDGAQIVLTVYTFQAVALDSCGTGMRRAA